MVLQFFKKSFAFSENLFQSYGIESVQKISSDFHIKTCRSLKRMATLKIPSTVLEEHKVYLFVLKLNLCEEAFFCVKAKTISHLSWNLLGAAAIIFPFTRWIIVF